MSTYQQQADEVECRFMEARDHLEILRCKPIGKGGLDPAEIKRREMRLDVLKNAAATLSRVAQKDAERRAAQVSEAAE
ncbi:hypothetical protein [Xanthobacter agilis]|uniref:Component of membrane protein insertase Oxa1/YidC/SpoIIIJ protein YidD n=1 Tax=Xanthobacter agilis TaxID=47492 RepID=A0ABU0LFQ7_XANAG|nr:hypothetical protein [Xanthobacter agilis]MDQ0505968.1 putative component of membrane protein insertase Oxa1/YidC/SpoIIIJ protein YidD [Xanthobacter agilis]